MKLTDKVCVPDFIGDNPLLPDKFRDDGIYQISTSEIQSFADKRTVETGISKAIMMWEDNNPELEFELIEEYGEIRIVFQKTMDGDRVGHMRGAIMEMGLGSYDCRGNWQQYSSNTIADIIAHELGHYLNLGHTTNESSLMHGEKNPMPENPFDDLGYNIPSKNEKSQRWIAYDQLLYNYAELRVKYNEYPRTTAEYNQMVQIHDEINEAATQLNCFGNP